ncbi:MAG: hypothetical protein ABSE62_02190 [Chthoniobacteraceae bacterium]
MPSPTSPNTAEPRRGRYEVAAGSMVAGVLLAVIAWLLAHTVFRGVGLSPRDIDLIRQTMLPGLRDNLQPKPLERRLFISIALLSPFCVLAGLAIARKAAGGAPRGVILGGVALAVGAFGVYLLHGGTLFQYFVFPTSPIVDLGIVYAAGGLLFLAAWRKAAVCGRDGLWRWIVAMVALAVALLPRGLSIRSILSTKEISPFAWENHFQAVAYPFTQVFAGKPLLTAAPPLYGNYAEFLLPIFKIIGLSVFKFCVVMGLIQAVALAAVLLVAVDHLRTWFARLLGCAALVYFIGSTCLVGRRPFDPVFQYFPIRFLFPALSVPLFLWASRRARPSAWLALGVFGGLGLMWNLDSGIAVAGATLFVLAVEAIAKRNRSALLALVITAVAMAATAALFHLFLEMQAGWKPPMHYTADYQRLYYQSGYVMVPIPLEPHPWWMVAAAYLFGMAFGVQRVLRGNFNATTRLALFLTILGVGLFTYYEGRSVDFNLMNAAWPAILLGAIFADRLLRAIRARALPRGISWLALPFAYLGLMALVMLPGDLAGVWSFGSAQWRAALAPSATGRADTINRRVQFIRSHVGADSECVILADYQAVYFMETGFRSTLDAPGLTEIFFMHDLDDMRAAMIQDPPRHLFADEATLKTLQLTDLVNTRFKLVSTSFDGKLWYLEPRAR